MSFVPSTITIKAGADYVYNLTATRRSGGAYDLTGHQLFGQIRRVPGGDLLATFSPSILSPATNGVATMSLTSKQTAKLPATSGPTTWYHDVIAVRPDGFKVSVVTLCLVQVIPEVTEI